jgi:PAS domain S-box-containing protein
LVRRRFPGALAALSETTMPQPDPSAEHARAHLAAIVDSAEDAILSKDLNGVIQTCNAAAERLFGYRAEELVGRSITTLIPPDRHHEETMILGKIRRGERVEHFETLRRAKDGHLVNVSLTISPIRDSGGNIIGASKIARDITQRKQAETELSYLAAIVESSDDAIISKNLQGVIRSCNPAAERLFGYSAAELIGQSVAILIPPELQADEAVILSRLRRGERIEHFETVRVTKDGRRIDVALTVSPILDSAGNVIGASKVARDIGDRKRAEAEKHDLLMREHAAREEAEQANRLKDEFLATLSHELRTPLNAIVGWADLIRAGVDQASLARAVEVIHRNAMTQNQLIADILDMQRISTGKLRLSLRELDLAEVIQAAVDTVRPAADAKQITLAPILDTKLGPVLGDPDRLQQVVWNLLSNAIKFTPKGGRVGISLVGMGSDVQIQVEDNGPGIDPQFMPYIFERFRQADSSSTRRQSGIGIGLAITRSLVELHGGVIAADNRGASHGALFTVRLPRRSVSTQQAVQASPESGSSAVDKQIWLADAPSLHGVKVLVVDDEPDAREIVATVLERCGADVLAARSAAEALPILLRDRPHVLVCDIEMPDEDGYAFIRRVRALARDKGGTIPAAALTAYAGTADRMRALRAGFQMHVPKPVQPAELATVIASLAERERATP